MRNRIILLVGLLAATTALGQLTNGVPTGYAILLVPTNANMNTLLHPSGMITNGMDSSGLTGNPSGAVTTNRLLTINGVGYTLDFNRDWIIDCISNGTVTINGQTITNGGVYTIATVSSAQATNIAQTVTASIMSTGNCATATSAGTVTGAQSNLIASALQPTSTNFPAQVVQTNQTDVTLVGFRFWNWGIRSLNPFGAGGIFDSTDYVLGWSDTTRYLTGTGSVYVADFSDTFRVGPDWGTNLPVYLTLTNLQATKLDATPAAIAAAGGLLSTGDISNVTGTLPAGVLGTNMVRTVGGLITTGTVTAGTISGLYTPVWKCTTNALGPLNPAICQYYAATTTNTLTVTNAMTSGSVIPIVSVRNTSASSINVIFADPGIKWTAGSMTNAIPASTMQTFGFMCSPISGATNGYATATSSN